MYSDDFSMLITRKKLNKENDFEESIKILCLKPAVVFSYLKACHSVILCSGTLSPLEAFETELDFEFQHKYVAPHVIDNKQVSK